MFTQATIVSIIGIKPATLQNWMNRGVLSIAKSSPGREKARTYDAVDVVQIAFVFELGKFGISPKEADWLFDKANAKIICDSILNDAETYMPTLQQSHSAVYVYNIFDAENGYVTNDLAISRPDIPYLIAKECPRAFKLFMEEEEDAARIESGLEPLTRPPAIPFDFKAHEAQIVFWFDAFCERIALALAERNK